MDERNGSQRALIVGLGISGMAMAKGLYECGWDVTVVERAPERRRGGFDGARRPRRGERAQGRRRDEADGGALGASRGSFPLGGFHEGGRQIGGAQAVQPF